RLFGPLGIQPADYTWETDPQGIPIGGYGLALRPRDMAKLGLLLEAGGRWDGAQVVPADWIATATRAHARTASGQDYGYLFWVYPSDFSAEGHGDQRIMVVPDKDLVVVTTAAHEDPTGRATQQRMLTDFLIPAATAHGPLPPNDVARGALQAKAEALADPARPVPPLPSTAARISGKRYQFPDNDSDWKALTATFTQGSPTAQVTIATTTGVEQVQVGLDNVYRLIPRPDGTIALRGRWTNDHTFVVHQLVMGDISEFDISLEFHDNQVAVHAEESVFHQNSFDVTGTAE
ncbi:MAG: hypothetical protein IRY97_10405, partial [Thermomicrobiaceae bacterium]|nr:hypothetical protein [Thermomicrobiaceae bacterium]